MKKIFLSVVIAFGLIGGLNAQEVDVLSLASKGALNENSVGVKKLSLEEKMQVVGGYYETLTQCGSVSCFAVALHNHENTRLTFGEDTAIKSVTYGDNDLYLGYMVQKNWSYSNLGTKFSYFTYHGVVVNARNGTISKQSSQVLNHNLVVKQLANKYKSTFDRNLGGLTIGY